MTAGNGSLSRRPTEGRPLLWTDRPQSETSNSQHQTQSTQAIGLPQEHGAPPTYTTSPPLPAPGFPQSFFRGQAAGTAVPSYPGMTVTGMPAPRFPVPIPLEFAGLPPPGTPVHPHAHIPRPAGSRVQIFVDEALAVHVLIPAAGVNSGGIFVFLFSIFWLSFSCFWLFGAISAGAPFFFWVFGVPFVAVGVMVLFQGMRNIFLKEHIVVDQHQFFIERDLLGWIDCHMGSRADISHVDVKVTGRSKHGEPYTSPVIGEGVTEHQFGCSLMPIEEQWVVVELSRLLQVPLGICLAAPGRIAPPTAMIPSL